MARDQIDMTPLQSRDELIAWLEAGVKPVSEFRIGTEHEKTPFTAEGHLPVPYEGGRGIGALLEGMKLLLGWEPIMERGNIIGLHDVTGGGAISLEPGGQFELSGAPVENVHQTQSELMAHLAQVREVAAPLGIRLSRARHDAVLVAGTDSDDAEGPLQDHDRLHAEGRPIRPRHDVPDLHGADESRLLLGSRHGQETPGIGGVAAGGDRLVCQFAVHRRQAQRLPVVPLRNLARYRQCALRMIPWAFEDGMGFERWVDYALDVPMYFVKRGDAYIDVAGSSFRDFFDGRNPVFPGERPTLSDWANHLSTIFPRCG